VNYPARENFDIRRMDSLQIVKEKSLKRSIDESSGKNEDGREQKSSDGVEEEEGCVCIHLPVMKVNDNLHPRDNNHNDSTQNTANHNNSDQEEDTNDNLGNTISAYNTEFNQPQHIQRKMYLEERNVMRSPSEGKANLDRYRLASARIFGLIDDTLGELLAISASGSDVAGAEDNNNNDGGGGGDKKSGYVLERASIDELFIDVTEFCYHVLDRERGKRKEECCKEKIDAGTNESNVNDDDCAEEAAADNVDITQIKRVKLSH